MSWEDSLPTLDLADIPPFYPDADAGRNVEAGIDEDLRHARRVSNREHLHMLRVANAAKHLERLPEPGESFHCIMRGNYNGWDLVPAVLRLADPAKIDTLFVATLGFNRQNAAELVSLVDAGSIARVSFICSCYYRSMESDVFEFLHASLTSKGHRAVAIRSHAKILLFEMADGTAYVVESSANLRSCRNIEQFCLTHDAELLRFHRAWMDEVIERCERHETT